jgi:hypothetical protein
MLEILDGMKNQSYLAFVHDTKLELLRVTKSRVCNKKPHKDTQKGAQYLTLLRKLKDKEKPSTKHVPCTANVTDEDPVKTTMTIDDSKSMLLFMAWGSDEDLRHITMFPGVLSIYTTYMTNRETRPLLVFAGTDHYRKNFTALPSFLPSFLKLSQNATKSPLNHITLTMAPSAPKHSKKTLKTKTSN